VYNDRNQRLARGVTLSISSNVLKPGAKGVWLTTMTDNPKRWHRVAITIGRTISADEMRASNYTGIRVDTSVPVRNNGSSRGAGVMPMRRESTVCS